MSKMKDLIGDIVSSFSEKNKLGISEVQIRQFTQTYSKEKAKGEQSKNSLKKRSKQLNTVLILFRLGGGHTVPPLCFSFICGPITTRLGMMVLWDKISEKP